MKSRKVFYFSALAVAILGVMLLLYRFVQQQHQISQLKEEKEVILDNLKDFERLAQMDSLLLQGDYELAIKSYSDTINRSKEIKMGIPLRIALAEKLLNQNRNPNNPKDSSILNADSLQIKSLSEEAAVRQFDSLSFNLEKTKLQLERVKKQLKQKSFGEYLTFKSRKGNQLHYIGQVKDGKAQGYGIALLATGSRYEGNWKNNQRHGQGTFYWPDGEYYSGEFKDDLRNGFGTYFWPNGEKYAGQWKEDKRSGSGKFFDSEGDVVASGEWNEDKLVEINDR
ncbi:MULTISPECIES: MORN repeat-containing protein [Maribacter]|uniref:Uncharacterized protein n=1 Tax=Maribacter flavus TaxID=1658664 RepID=A0A5B2TRR3_9FLAO|nr:MULTISPECIES: hypothetical protein [Maribacter]KAA2216954.1 hypothetical protein F0361_13275 [Maribacter flavus]MDC6405656.1 hypothetical protein [Maribacter sp. PR66]MEE1972576.1 hypothetical protein [Maribacter flavus]